MRKLSTTLTAAAALGLATLLIALALPLLVAVGTAANRAANPAPPTEGGNGAGYSGQCTGPQNDRPNSCQSQGGPGNQP